MRPALRRLAPAAALAFALGCARDTNSAFAPAGPQAERLYDVTIMFVAVCGTVWLIVTALWIAALLRRNREDPPARDAVSEQKMHRMVAGAVGVTVLVLVGFLAVEFATSRANAAAPDEAFIDIHIVGHQWWWEIHYEDSVPSRRVTTANELHVPVGRAVRLKLTANDVIHSFWAPNLHGKLDLIPGQTNSLHFRVDRPGVYRGKCAEFCGLQHAKMDIIIVAESEADFAAYLARSRRAAAPPADSLRQRGQEVFLAGACVMCHTVRGTPAGGRLGPDLTHLASRRTIAAGALPNRKGYLAGWILDPQTIKPGARMPANDIPAADLEALLAYLGGLE